MKKTLTAVALTAALTGGTGIAVTTFAAPAQAAPPVAAGNTGADQDESDKTGLWGLLGLLGLAGLAKRKEHHDTHSTTGSTHR